MNWEKAIASARKANARCERAKTLSGEERQLEMAAALLDLRRAIDAYFGAFEAKTLPFDAELGGGGWRA